MTELETALTKHDWGHNGCKTRPELDRLIQAHSDSVEAKVLWEKHCPWSDTNGGFAAWSQQ